jgi:hypothetical protein
MNYQERKLQRTTKCDSCNGTGKEKYLPEKIEQHQTNSVISSVLHFRFLS